MQMPEYELQHPNDCNLNYIQVRAVDLRGRGEKYTILTASFFRQIFDGQTDQLHEKKKFCGSIAETFSSKTNIVYVRFFAEVQGLESQFQAVATVFTPTTEDEPCDPEVYFDCEDTNCISNTLLCNGNRNCKFGWDEEADCKSEEDQPVVLDVASPHVAVVLAFLFVIFVGMCGGVVWNVRKVVAEDREQLAASQEKDLGGETLGHLVVGEEGGLQVPPVLLPGDPENMGRVKKPSAGLQSSSAVLYDGGKNGGCHVPDAGFAIRPSPSPRS